MKKYLQMTQRALGTWEYLCYRFYGSQLEIRISAQFARENISIYCKHEAQRNTKYTFFLTWKQTWNSRSWDMHGRQYSRFRNRNTVLRQISQLLTSRQKTPLYLPNGIMFSHAFCLSCIDPYWCVFLFATVEQRNAYYL